MKAEYDDKFYGVHEKHYDRTNCDKEMRKCWQFWFEWGGDEDNYDKRGETQQILSYIKQTKQAWDVPLLKKGGT